MIKHEFIKVLESEMKRVEEYYNRTMEEKKELTKRNDLGDVEFVNMKIDILSKLKVTKRALKEVIDAYKKNM